MCGNGQSIDVMTAYCKEGATDVVSTVHAFIFKRKALAERERMISQICRSSESSEWQHKMYYNRNDERDY